MTTVANSRSWHETSVWSNSPALLLFFLMLAFPMILSFLYVKAALFAVLLIVVLVKGLNSFYLHSSIILWSVALVLVGLIFALRGLYLGAPGAIQCIETYAIWPAVYTILLSGINKLQILRALEKTVVFSTAFIGIFGLLYLLSELNILPRIPNLGSFLSTEDLGSGFYEGHVELALPGLNSLPFLVPFILAAFMVRPSTSENVFVSKRSLSLAALVSLPIVLLSGRRALQGVTMLAPILTVVLGYLLPKPEREFLSKRLVGVVAFLVLFFAISVPLLSSLVTISFGGLAERFSSGFDFSSYNSSDSSIGRREQYAALMHEWLRKPLLGFGLGATAHRSIRSELTPWAYELYYLDLLFQTGLLGFTAYSAGIAWLYATGIRIIKAGGTGGQFMIPALVGLSCFLVANGTNPYLARFDGIWVIFFPLAFINYSMININRSIALAVSGSAT